MIHVDIYVSAVCKTYEFSLNEMVGTKEVMEEVANVISQQEQRAWSGNLDELMLCNLSTKMILPKNKSLNECNVCDGMQLLLI